MFASLRSKLDKVVSGFSSAVLDKEVSEEDLADQLWQLQMALLENDVALEVAERVCDEVRGSLVGSRIRRGAIVDSVQRALVDVVTESLDRPLDFISETGKKQPFIVLFVGINGTGKTTSIAKVGRLLLDNGKSVVFAAADTFRAAALEQLETHGRNLGIRVIKHDYGADAAAVCFDAVRHAEAKGIDVVLVDTAGRIQTNVNLMDELEKIIRVNHPDFVMFVGDALTGNDAVEQAKTFKEKVGIDGIVLTKVDADAKGGSSLSISYVTRSPIVFIGTGQEYEDLESFDPQWFIEQITSTTQDEEEE